MYRPRLLVGLALILTAAGCADATAPESAAPVTEMSFSRGMSSETTPFYNVTINNCTGEMIELSGRLHMAWHSDENGFMSQTNYQGVSGLGLTTQAQYRSTAMDHFKMAGPLPEKIFWKGHFTLVGQGGVGRLHVTVMYTFNVDHNGEAKPGGHDVLTIRCSS